MNNPVIIKGNKNGIRLIISPDASQENIKQELEKKLQNKKNYYKNIKPIDISFDGKVLTDDETNEILSIFKKIGLNINNKNNTLNESKEKSFTDLHPDKDGLFYIGNLKNGQSINASTSIIIVGNIEQGASVVSEGNIIVIGNLFGYAKAGIKGNKDAFVYNLWEEL